MGSLWQSYKDEPYLNGAGIINKFPVNSASYKVKQNISGKTGVDGTKDVKIIAQLKYLNHFWKTLEMSLINCEINFILTWS